MNLTTLMGLRKELIDRPRPAKVDDRGCDYCPRNGVPGINKVMGQVLGRKIMVWAQSPGYDENEAGRELVGRAGAWLWKELQRVGISREDCDIQNVVRCMPANRVDGDWVGRDPSKDERYCCSLYTERAKAETSARVWLVFGKIAAEELFGKRGKSHVTEKVFYHGNIQVFLMDHPSFFLRGAPKERLDQFRHLLEYAADSLHKGNGQPQDKFAILSEQDYQLVTTPVEAYRAIMFILSYANEDERIVYDVEWDTIDGRSVLLCVGASPKPGIARVFLLDHPANETSREERRKVWGAVRFLLRHPHKKAMHYGCSDCTVLSEAGIEVKGFDYDTQYAEFMVDPTQKSYSLGNIVNRKLVRFSGYKNIVLPEAVPPGMEVEDAKDLGEFHLSRVPLDRLTLYNGCDCDMEKRIEVGTRNKVPLKLVKVYSDASFVLMDMENFGPILDYKQADKLLDMYPYERNMYLTKLRKLSGNPELNPNAPKQVAKVLYDDLELTLDTEEETRSTKKEILDTLIHKYPKVAFPKVLSQYRGVKNLIERVDALKRSADVYRGRARTIFWLTGARTGRISSGGGARKDKRNLSNFQNIPRNDHLKNALVSDSLWEELVDTWTGTHRASHVRDYHVFLALDYSQMELRILAQMTEEPELIRLFNEGVDIHAAVGALWSGWSFQELIDDEYKRRIVKAFHFGIIYGLSAWGLFKDLLAQGIQVTQRQVEKMHKDYFARFDRVRAYIREQPLFVKEHGYAENIFGFRVPIDETGGGTGAYWENQAVNSPIQGGAHQVLLCALALIRRNPEKYSMLRLQMEIHDSLVAVSRIDKAVETARVLKALLEKDVVEMTTQEFGIKWKVPLVADLKLGFRLGALAKGKSLAEMLDKAVEMSKRQDQDFDARLLDLKGVSLSV